MNQLKSLRRVFLFVSTLVCRCATASNRHQRIDVRLESPRAALVLLLPALLLTVSCASVLNGRSEIISVDSAPQGAEATLSCGVSRVGSVVTPAKFTIARNAGDCTLTVSKHGFTEQSASIEQGVNPMYWANFVTFPVAVLAAWNNSAGILFAGNGVGLGLIGVSGFITDYATGAIHTHRPRKVVVKLQPN